jgi:hypothetical protein
MIIIIIIFRNILGEIWNMSLKISKLNYYHFLKKKLLVMKKICFIFNFNPSYENSEKKICFIFNFNPSYENSERENKALFLNVTI